MPRAGRPERGKPKVQSSVFDTPQVAAAASGNIRDARPIQTNAHGGQCGLRGGASVTAGSTNPGEREREGARRNEKRWSVGGWQRRNRIGRAEIANRPHCVEGYRTRPRAGGGRAEKAREIAGTAGEPGTQAGREERAAARNRGAPQRHNRYIFFARNGRGGIKHPRRTSSHGRPRPHAESRVLRAEKGDRMRTRERQSE